MRQLIRSPLARIEQRRGPHAFRAVLPNGHCLTAILQKRRAASLPIPTVGDEVLLEISPADFSIGFICDVERGGCDPKTGGAAEGTASAGRS